MVQGKQSRFWWLLALDQELIGRGGEKMRSKRVWKGGRELGLARTWGDVARITGDRRGDNAAEALSREGSEGPEGFYLEEKGLVPRRNGT